jgi:outer membrane receptor protein involved in Fe transport
MSTIRFFPAIVVFGLLAVPPAQAQTTGTITGTVTDTSSAVIPGVKVVADGKTTGERRETTTNQAGQYTLAFLPPGDYEVQFSVTGFALQTRTATLAVTERIAVDAVMKPAGVTERVDVSAGGEMLQTESTALGRVVDGGAVKELPLSTRNFTQLLTLSPGTSSQLNNAGALGRGTQIISASGARTTSNAIMIDGVDALNIHTNAASDNGVGSNGIMTPSPEAIQEFKVQTSLYDAQSGRSGGANVSVVTKSGTPQFHGSAFEFFRNEHLNANDFFFNSTGTPRAELRQNQFGGTLGGPVRKEKTFFFLSYQGMRQLNGLSGSFSLTLPAIPLDRSAASLGKAFGGQKGRGGTVVAADGSNINPVSLALLNIKLADGSYMIPSPQTSAPGVNYNASVAARYTDDQGIANIDHHFSESNRLAVRIMIGDEPTWKPTGSASVPGFGSTQDFSNKNISVTDVHVFSGALVNEARIGLSRVLGVVVPQTKVLLKDIGMTRFNSADYPDIPLITQSGGFAIGYDTNGDQMVKPTTWHLNDTVSWFKGRHELRLGIEFRHYIDDYYSRNRYRGTITLPSMADFLIGRAGTAVGQGGNGSGTSNLSATEVGTGIPDGADRITDVAPFVQDTWKVTPRLTITAGLRWEYTGFPVDKYGRRGNFDYRLYQAPSAGGFTSAGFVQSDTAPNPLPGLPKVAPELVDHVPMHNFAPRLGIAYKLSNRIVLRAGYGLFYDRLSNQLGLLTSQSAPNYLRAAYGSADTVPYSLQNPFPTLPLGSQFPQLPVIYAPPYTANQPAIGLNSMDPKLRVPYLNQWGLNVQWEAVRDTLVEVGYVGTKGTSLPVRRAIDQAVLASPDHPVNGITTNTTANTALRVPYEGFSPNGLLAEETDADSRYNSLQASVTRRFSHGLRFLASYTFSKSMDDTSGGSTTIFSEITGDESNLRSSKGVSDFDRTHRLVVNFSYEIPNFGGRYRSSGAGKRIFGGWMLSGVTIWQSGTPFTISDSGGGTFFGTTGSRANYAPGASAATASYSTPVEQRLNAYFNVAAFTKAGTYFGNVGRNTMRGPRQRNFDFSLNKRTAITEKLQTEFRTEFFNAFNMVNFASPAGNVNSSGVGIIKSTNGNPRVIQFAMKVIF